MGCDNYFSYEMMLFERGKAKGTEREANIIIRLLDNIPGTAIMVRNILVLLVFSHRYPQMVELTSSLSELLRIFEPAPRPLVPLIRKANRSLCLACLIVTANFVLLLMSYFNANFSDIYGKWRFYPFPMTLIGWQVGWCLTVFTLPPFLAAQVILVSVIGLASGGVHLIQQLNRKLVLLSETSDRHPRHGLGHGTTDVSLKHGDGSRPDRDQDDRLSQYEKICAVRLAHFRISHFIRTVTEAFSELLLVVIGADFAAAVGYVGLLIGRPPSTVRHLFG